MTFFTELKRRNVLRVVLAYLAASWLIVQVAETVLPILGFSLGALRVLLVLLLVGLLISAVLAWVYELTPEGLKLERDIDREQSVTRQTGRKLDRVVIVVLGVALAYFIVDKYVVEPVRDEQRLAEARQQSEPTAAEATTDPSIAVLPFADMSADQNQQYFSDGLAEELINLLSRDRRVAGDLADLLVLVHRFVCRHSVRRRGTGGRLTFLKAVSVGSTTG